MLSDCHRAHIEPSRSFNEPRAFVRIAIIIIMRDRKLQTGNGSDVATVYALRLVRVMDLFVERSDDRKLVLICPIKEHGLERRKADKKTPNNDSDKRPQENAQKWNPVRKSEVT